MPAIRPATEAVAQELTAGPQVLLPARRATTSGAK